MFEPRAAATYQCLWQGWLWAVLVLAPQHHPLPVELLSQRQNAAGTLCALMQLASRLVFQRRFERLMHITGLRKRVGWVRKIWLSWICYLALFHLFWIMLILGEAFTPCHDKLSQEAAQKALHVT